MQLDFLPEGKIERELWLKTQLRNMEQQFQQVADRIDQVLPAKQAEQFYKSMDNAREYMQADIESLPTDGPLNVVRTDQVPAGEFISPSITRQQIEAASRANGFSQFSPGNQKIALADVLPKWKKAQAAHLEKTLRTGFLLGQTNQEIMREFGALGPGKKGWAMTQAVVRTSMSEASQAAHDAFFEANEDLLPKVPGGYRWEWDASNDTRLCPQCAPLDGMRWKKRSDVPAKPHWSCRCQILPITATQAALRERGDVPEGSFLERREVKKIGGKNEKAPAGWQSTRNGGTAYARPQRIDGKSYWVRRKDLPKGQTHAGDMLKRMNPENRAAVLGSNKMAEKFDVLTKKGARYENDPQEAVRQLLRNKDNGGLAPQKPRPQKRK